MLLPYQFCMEEIEGFRYRCRVRAPAGGKPGDLRPRSMGSGSPAIVTFCFHPRTLCVR